MIEPMDPVTETDIQFSMVEELLGKAEWKYAKTMPKHPHWYSLRRKWDRKDLADKDFVDVVLFIRAHGTIERFPCPVKGKKYTVFYCGGYKYWTMGCPIWSDPRYDTANNTCLINRTPAENVVDCEGVILFDDAVALKDVKK